MRSTDLSATIPYVSGQIETNHETVVKDFVQDKIDSNHEVVVKSLVDTKVKDNDLKLRNWVVKKIEEEMKKYGCFSAATIRRL
ncbi:MAG: hypothetical protein FVQ80_07115 [Planctomycetes bacterium]|nr:hypothetical protein [Planctomycetota bacterium]